MPRAKANALAKLTPTSSAPTSPGPLRDGDRVDRLGRRAGILERARHHRHDRREMLARRDLRHDTAEHAMHVLRQDDERLDAHVVPGAAITAADVSSHDVSIPRMRVIP